MFEKLINVVEQRTAIEEVLKRSKDAWAEENAVRIAQLEDLKEKETLLRDEALASLDKLEKDSIEEGDKVIYKQARVTRSVDDAAVLRDAMFANRVKLEALGVVPTEETLFRNEVVVNDKKAVMDIIDMFQKTEGVDLEGVLVKETKFITIKTKNTN